MKMTMKEINEIEYVNGMDQIRLYYTGGGIYCFDARLTDSLFVYGSTEGNVWLVDSRPEDEDDAFGYVWINKHLVCECTEEESKSWTYSILSLIREEHGNSEIVNIKECNYSMSDVEDWLTELGKSNGSQWERKEIECGPCDLILSWLLDKANADKYENRDSSDTPSNAWSVCRALGEIENLLCEETRETYLLIDKVDGWYQWNVRTDTTDLKPEYECYVIEFDGDYTIYKMEYIGEYKKIETVYSEEGDKTFFMEQTYNKGKLISEEVTGFCHGVPNENDIAFFSHGKHLIAKYTF